MKCVIAVAFLALALPAMSAPAPGLIAGTTLLRSAYDLEPSVIASPAAIAVGPATISSQSTVIAHPSPAITYQAAPAIVSAPAVYAAPSVYSAPSVYAAAPLAKSTVIAGPSGTITETQGLGALAYSAPAAYAAW